MSHPRALIYGTIALDTLYTPRGEATSVLGGSGPYAALAARLLSSHCCLLGVVGEDYPTAFREQMEACGVSFRHVAQIPGKTFSWKARYEEDMNQRTSLFTEEGVQEIWQATLPPELAASELLVACNVTPRLQTRVLEQCTAARFRMADFMKSWILREREYVDTLLSRVDLALMNDEEACCYADTGDPLLAGRRLLEVGPSYVIVKHGSAGSTLFHRDTTGSTRIFRIPAWPLESCADPTGAGDSYMGALAGYLVEHLQDGRPDWRTMKRGIAYATVIAAATCESFGTLSLMRLTAATVRQRMQDFHLMTCWE